MYSANTDFGNERWKDVMSCWIIGTYFHRMFSAYPYVHLNGNRESGKTKTMQLSMLLSFNGEMSVNSSSAYLIRVINDNNASCGIDESEKLGNTDDNQTLVAMYNAGYKKGVTVGKAEQTDKKNWAPKKFDPYSPKIFSGIKRLDPTLASRVIPITMLRSANKQIKNREINIEDPVFQEIRDELYLIMMSLFEKIKNVYQSIEENSLSGREWELWKPLLSMAKVISEELYTSLKYFALEIQEQKKESIEEDAPALKLLESLLALMEKRLGRRTILYYS